ncbi:citramalate synthase [Devriesea agamarum]|uniref:citramalate synthase n=1 Tax=Devriesea agamarum TaxID=472569 RepID=UPI00071C3239|nr:citramalate synthase [Devriesea agamarum]
MPAIHVYDTTLRDGSQQEGLTLSVGDKIAVAKLLDGLGVTHIEGGWPGAVPKDTEFFARAQSELNLRSARLAAFGATRKAGMDVRNDPQVAALLASKAPVITLVAKSDLRQVIAALRTTPEENLAMVRETVGYLRAEGREVYLDAEHFFDGFVYHPEYAAAVVHCALEAGAQIVALCDTNGGMLPHRITEVIEQLTRQVAGMGLSLEGRLGIHAHNDSGCAVANSIAAIRAGAVHLQGCINGYGERTGNADLLTVVANLQLKEGFEILPDDRLAEMTRIAHAIGEIANLPTPPRSPYVGGSAFAHKAGLHASAIRVDADLYQHIDPHTVGNDMRMIISDMAGRASIELKGRELGLDLGSDQDTLTELTATVKEREARGYSYEAADASFELLVLDRLGKLPTYYTVETWRALTQQLRDGFLESEAIVKIVRPATDGGSATVTGKSVALAEGNGPVNALDEALRAALRPAYPEIDAFELQDFKVRILDADRGTNATTRVLVRTSGMGLTFSTVGIGPNIVEASWEAVTDAYTYGFLKVGIAPRGIVGSHAS